MLAMQNSTGSNVGRQVLVSGDCGTLRRIFCRSVSQKAQRCLAFRSQSLVCKASQISQAAAVASQPEISSDKMEPLGDRVLVKPTEASETTEGGIIVAPSAQKNIGISDAVIGEVLAVGSEVNVKVSKGDTVIFSKYSTSDIPAPGGDVTFVAQKSILAVLSQ